MPEQWFNIIGGFESFSGVFDGNEYVISNLSISQTDRAFVGLFSRLYHAEIKNIGLDNIRISGRNYVGGLVGLSEYSAIRKCYTTGTIKAFVTTDEAWQYCGGLIGNNYGYYGGDIIDCYSNCDVATNGMGIGGLIGVQWGGQIVNCYATGNVAGYSYLGGLVGAHATVDWMPAMGVIERSFATGSVSGESRIGGLVGNIGSGIIRNSYSTGSVSGNNVIGGLTGSVYLYPNIGYGDAFVEKSYSIGKVTGNKKTGGLVGTHWNQSMKVYNSFWDTQTSGWTYSNGGIGKTTPQMQTQSTFTGWNFNNVWYMADYPVLQWEISPLQPLIDAAQDGDVIVVDPGIYEGRLNFKGKNIVLASVDPADPNVVAATVLQGRGVGSVVTFNGSENENCVLDGFTITGGYNTASPGWGIRGNDSTATIRNCVVRDNTVISGPGGGIWGIAGSISHCVLESNHATSGGGLARCNGVISNCLIINNTSDGYATAVHNCDELIINCTIINNLNDVPLAKSLVHMSDGLFENCIMQTTSEIIFSSSTASTRYCCWVGAGGEGDIDVDPLFVDPSGADYRLLPGSSCINAGNPNYVSDSNDVDLDGNPRLTGPRIDIGAYEFPNTAPVADAGADQTVYAFMDGYALVQLDGTGSSDADGDVLEYYWFNDANDLIATGAEPNVLLPVGEHEITLFVNDGIADSEPDVCVVTVIDPFDALTDDVTELVQHKGIANSLLAKMDAARKKLEDGNENNDGAAVGSLGALINAVNAQRGKKISEEDADYLISVAEQIINML